ncbi:CO dehydrogenase nickel-insertion accessory protein CooC1 [Caldalkalibacillus uzonensis]|uniref:CO dehydrogenase nickel-insertion accessory protein CooC1 n=1 Tax=Caldalkalibacillus uzonensis TaxID=353224 RepID=A0ABU0CP57_9BACI|nr:hypothetical protein [Caldalkalibacillus uzonensis]MDQ0338200.1 CO dehydrogenase nickel-insertion accessory protein CooC1 [Caldalkalibacillus uzonensis]
MSIIVLNPTEKPLATAKPLAERLKTLDGKVLGVINNNKTNAPVFLHYLAEQMKKRQNIKDVIWINKKNHSLPINAEELEKVQQCDAVISGVGD